MKRVLSGFSLYLSLAFLLLAAYLAVVGFPAPEWLNFVHLKNCRKPFEFFLLFYLLSIFIHPNRAQKWEGLKTFLSGKAAFVGLLLLYFILFLWHEIAEYLAMEINFIPFGFYDYMLYYFPQGKINYTGFLHGFYHINNVLYLLMPVWLLFQSSLVLIVAYPLLIVLAGVPLYALAKHYFQKSFIPILIVFLFFNFRYLQNMLHMNFTVEIFYPLFFFSLVYFAVSVRWFWYFLFLFLSLSIKEDAPFYLCSFGFLMLFMKGKRIPGLLTIVLSGAYFYWINHVFVVWTDSDIFTAVSRNFKEYGSSSFDILKYGATHIPEMVQQFLGTEDAWKTLSKALRRFLFIPLLSPWFLAALGALFPLFVRGGENFLQLRFQYAAPFIGFLFPAFIDGLRRFAGWLDKRQFSKENVLSVLLIILLFMNGGNYRVPSWDVEDVKTIRMAREIPEGKTVVTHGHLLPYIGYRDPNFFFQEPLEAETHPLHSVYENADVYLIAKNVNPYPMSEGFVEKKIGKFMDREDYVLEYEDGVRYLFVKK